VKREQKPAKGLAPPRTKSPPALEAKNCPSGLNDPSSNFFENNAMLNGAATAHLLAPVDMLVGNVQKFILLVAAERGFLASIDGNG
jgi:hypothetical protein